MINANGFARRFVPLLAVMATLALGGCSWLDSQTSKEDKPDAQYVERPIDQIYSDAWKKVRGGDWAAAAQAIRRSGAPASLFGMGAPCRC